MRHVGPARGVVRGAMKNGLVLDNWRKYQHLRLK
jgi:hypothetical protein